MAAGPILTTPHEISDSRLSELQSEAGKLVESVGRLKARMIEFDDDPTTFLVALRSVPNENGRD